MRTAWILVSCMAPSLAARIHNGVHVRRVRSGLRLLQKMSFGKAASGFVCPGSDLWRASAPEVVVIFSIFFGGFRLSQAFRKLPPPSLPISGKTGPSAAEYEAMLRQKDHAMLPRPVP